MPAGADSGPFQPAQRDTSSVRLGFFCNISCCLCLPPVDNVDRPRSMADQVFSWPSKIAACVNSSQQRVPPCYTDFSRSCPDCLSGYLLQRCGLCLLQALLPRLPVARPGSRDSLAVRLFCRTRIRPQGLQHLRLAATKLSGSFSMLLWALTGRPAARCAATLCLLQWNMPYAAQTSIKSLTPKTRLNHHCTCGSMA